MVGLEEVPLWSDTEMLRNVRAAVAASSTATARHTYAYQASHQHISNKTLLIAKTASID